MADAKRFSHELSDGRPSRNSFRLVDRGSVGDYTTAAGKQTLDGLKVLRSPPMLALAMATEKRGTVKHPATSMTRSSRVQAMAAKPASSLDQEAKRANRFDPPQKQRRLDTLNEQRCESLYTSQTTPKEEAVLPKLITISKRASRLGQNEDLGSYVPDAEGRKTIQVIRDNLASRDAQDNYSVLLELRDQNKVRLGKNLTPEGQKNTGKQWRIVEQKPLQLQI